MVLSWITERKEEGEKRRTLNEIKESRTVTFTEYAKSEYHFRILSSLYIFSIVVIVGIIAYNRTIVTFREQFPTGEDETSTYLSIRVFLVPTSDSVYGRSERVREHVDKSFLSVQQPALITIAGRVEILYNRSLASLDLNSHPSPSSSLDFFIALVPSNDWPHFSATSILLTTGKWILVQVRENEDESKLLERMDELIFEILIGIPHLDLIAKRDRRERLQPWQISAMSPDHQKRLTWDCTGLSPSYSLRVIHLHSSCLSPGSCDGSTVERTLVPSLIEIKRRVEHVISLDIKSEHIFDVYLDPFLHEDVQGRQTMNQPNLYLLLKEIDSLISPTQSVDPQLKLVIVHSERKIIMVDGEGEDVWGASVSEWGGVIMNDVRVTPNVISSLRMLLGIDSSLPPTFKSVP
ncbi:hypothetical protein PFISCL1PPCAC_15520, partial [Pristionchus fissidentatus]